MKTGYIHKICLALACALGTATAVENAPAADTSTSAVQAAPETESPVIQVALAIERLAANPAIQTTAAADDEKFHKLAEAEISKLTTPESLFALAVLLYDGYREFFGTPFDRHMFAAQGMAVIHLARLGTEEAYSYFKALKSLHGRDGAGSMQFRVLEFRHFKQYSDDPKVTNAKSDKEFI